jgi:hypothetical protein
MSSISPFSNKSFICSVNKKGERLKPWFISVHSDYSVANFLDINVTL